MLSRTWLKQRVLRELANAQSKHSELVQNAKQHGDEEDREVNQTSLQELYDDVHNIKCVFTNASLEAYDSVLENGPVTSLRGGIIGLVGYKVQLHPEGDHVSVHLVIESFKRIGGEGAASSIQTKPVSEDIEVHNGVAAFFKSLQRYPSQDSVRSGKSFRSYLQLMVDLIE
ncbi:hypothetical protein HK097_000437 [Rhizophlyctis rosea]|uniref:Uncharacterized protein n=1 Tax=Rhizophlyctis rosea TaxID=64517 RepID=A0AAD5X1G0_9FUNG|nr:hypothetical protein HK097_000437 [Rhizophlyctis rosea]